MIINLRLILLFSALFLPPMAYHADGQDSLGILSNAWSELKTQLQRKSDVSVYLASFISKSEKADKKLVEKIKSKAADLSLFIDSIKNFDSMTVQKTYQKHNNLTRELSEALILLLEDTKSKSQQELRVLQVQLEGMENRIAAAKRNYNDLCIEHKRTDLIFGDTSPEKARQVSF